MSLPDIDFWQRDAREAGVKWIKELSWQQMDRMTREHTVILLAVGPIEQHGPHSPLGVDIYVAEYMAARLSVNIKKVFPDWNVCIAPTISYCLAVLSRDYPGSTSLRRETVRNLLQEVTGSFAANGFIHQVVTSHHIEPGNVVAMDEAFQLTNRKFQARVIHGYNRLIMDAIEAGEFPDITGLPREAFQGELHAGALETSEIMYLRPDLVDLNLIKTLPDVSVDIKGDILTARSFRQVGNGLGYQGNLALSRPEYGKKMLDVFEEKYAALVIRHLMGEDMTESLYIPHWWEKRYHTRDFQALLNRD